MAFIAFDDLSTIDTKTLTPPPAPDYPTQESTPWLNQSAPSFWDATQKWQNSWDAMKPGAKGLINSAQSRANAEPLPVVGNPAGTDAIRTPIPDGNFLDAARKRRPPITSYGARKPTNYQ